MSPYIPVGKRNKAKDRIDYYNHLHELKWNINILMTEPGTPQYVRNQLRRMITRIKVQMRDLEEQISIKLEGPYDKLTITDGQKRYPRYDAKKENKF